jgi:hypothetical protein
MEKQRGQTMMTRGRREGGWAQEEEEGCRGRGGGGCKARENGIDFLKHFLAVLRSRSCKEPHHFGGAGAETRFGPGSDGSSSKRDVQHRYFQKITQIK